MTSQHPTAMHFNIDTGRREYVSLSDAQQSEPPAPLLNPQSHPKGQSQHDDAVKADNHIPSIDSLFSTLSLPSPELGLGLSAPPHDSASDTESLLTFAHDLPFSLFFQAIAYPPWAGNSTTQKPLHYLPVPLVPLPGIPTIPTELDVPFTQIMDGDMLADTVDEILRSYGYQNTLSSSDVWKVYVSYTHKGGVRDNFAVNAGNVELLTRPWAKDVWLGHLSAVAGNCSCEKCKEETAKHKYGHGLEVHVVFPQGSDEKWTEKDVGAGYLERKKQVESWAGKEKLPFLTKTPERPKKISYADFVKAVRF